MRTLYYLVIIAVGLYFGASWFSIGLIIAFESIHAKLDSLKGPKPRKTKMGEAGAARCTAADTVQEVCRCGRKWPCPLHVPTEATEKPFTVQEQRRMLGLA